jgi:hypothetical protein
MKRSSRLGAGLTALCRGPGLVVEEPRGSVPLMPVSASWCGKLGGSLAAVICRPSAAGALTRAHPRRKRDRNGERGRGVYR